MNGAICIVWAMKRARYALKERWSVLQVCVGSQVISLIMFDWAKKVALRLVIICVMRVCQRGELFVWESLKQVELVMVG